jgi:Ca2+-binding RTX toxin-like protein
MLWLALIGAAITVGALVNASDDDDAVDSTEVENNPGGNGGNGGNGNGGGEIIDESVLFYGGEDVDRDDTEAGGNNSDTIYGGGGDDTLTGNAGNDGLDGESGNDILDGGEGNDVIQGGYGDDTLTGGAGDDFLLGESGNDHIEGGEDNDGVHGGNGEDTLLGGAGDDLLSGGTLSVDDQLVEEWLAGFESAAATSVGGTQTPFADDYNADTIDGGEGNDTLIGGADDLLTGGEGADVFVSGDWFQGGGDAPEITDFDTGEDAIVYRYDETGPEPVLSTEVYPHVDGLTGNVIIEADGEPAFVLKDVSLDFDLASHVTLLAAPIG